MTKVLLTATVILSLTQGFINARRPPQTTANFEVEDNSPNPSPTPTSLPEHWFHQIFDHFSPADGRYWQQRYYINDTYYKPGGPAFLYISGEGTLNYVYMQTGAWLEYAKEYHAICYGLEHRYYGHSRPTSDLSTANLQYLTIEQALADAATFISYMNKQPNMKNIKWVVFGGSYAGMLSAWMRYKFPHLVSGAVAHSATIAIPVINTDFADVMGDALRTVPGCFESVTAAFDDIRTKVKTDTGTKNLRDLFNWCDFDRNNPLDVDNVMNAALSTLTQVIQYSNDHWGIAFPMLSVSDMCGVLTDKTKGQPLERLADYSAHFSHNFTRRNGSCVPVTFNSTFENANLVDFESNGYLMTGRQWRYQTCTQLGDDIISESGSKPFGKMLSVDYYVKSCQGFFGSKFDLALTTRGTRDLLMNYAGLKLKTTHVVYTQGSFDPFHVEGFNKDNIPGSHVFLIQGVGHVAAQFSSSPLDSDQLKQVRTKIKRYIGQWISSGNDPIIG